MTVHKIVNAPFRYVPNRNRAEELIKVNKLRSKANYQEQIFKQVNGIYLLRHQIGLNNALSRVQDFKLCKKILDHAKQATS